MIDAKRKAFRDADFNSNTDPKEVSYAVGQKFDDAGLPNPYIEDQGDPAVTGDERDGRGLPANFGVSTEVVSSTLTSPETVDSRLSELKPAVGETATK